MQKSLAICFIVLTTLFTFAGLTLFHQIETELMDTFQSTVSVFFFNWYYQIQFQLLYLIYLSASQDLFPWKLSYCGISIVWLNILGAIEPTFKGFLHYSKKKNRINYLKTSISILMMGISYMLYPDYWEIFYSTCIIFRFVQGVGSGLTIVSGFSILVYLKPRHLQFTLGTNIIFLWVGVLVGINVTKLFYMMNMVGVFIGYFLINLCLGISNSMIYHDFRKDKKSRILFIDQTSFDSQTNQIKEGIENQFKDSISSEAPHFSQFMKKKQLLLIGIYIFIFSFTFSMLYPYIFYRILEQEDIENSQVYLLWVPTVIYLVLMPFTYFMIAHISQHQIMTYGLVIEGISFLFMSSDTLIGISDTASSFIVGLIFHGISCSLSLFPISILLYSMIYQYYPKIKRTHHSIYFSILILFSCEAGYIMASIIIPFTLSTKEQYTHFKLDILSSVLFGISIAYAIVFYTLKQQQ